MKQNKDTFRPYISANESPAEFSFTSILLGIILAIVFGAANAYLGLRVGLTVSASIPAAVISMGLIRVILKRDSILENNMVQTIGSAGESVAAGSIFTIPVLFMWAEQWGEKKPSLLEITCIALIGGILGVFFMVPLRKALIVKEHHSLPYPEGTACAEVLLAGEEKGSKSTAVFAGLGISAIYKFIGDGLKLFPTEIHYELKKFKGGGIGIDVLPALLGVGYICGFRIATYMFAGGIMAWLVIMPLISMFGGNSIIFPGSIPISEMSAFNLWGSYIRYIGAGAVATGGIISLIKSLPLIIKTFKHALGDYKSTKYNTNTSKRTEQDLPIKLILFSIVVVAFIIWLIPIIPVNLFGAIIIIIFGFFFATVSSRLVGLVGSSNNPVSGMSIATLLISTFILKSIGNIGHSGMVSAIAIGSIVCIIAAMAGDTSQDLKTGFLLGATPKKQQLGELVGVISASFAIGGVLFLLNAAWGYGSPELPAPQATLMKMVIEGVMEGNLPWVLVISGAFIAIIMELLRIPVLPFAVGLYLPIHLNAGIMVGGLIRLFFEKRKYSNEKAHKSLIDKGILFTSGLIAGEGLIGILLAVFALIPIGNSTLSSFVNLSDVFYIGNIGGLTIFIILIATMFYFTQKDNV